MSELHALAEEELRSLFTLRREEIERQAQELMRPQDAGARQKYIY